MIQGSKFNNAKTFELRTFEIFMLWCSWRSVTVIIVSIFVLCVGVVLSVCCLCRYRPFIGLIPHLGNLILVFLFYSYRFLHTYSSVFCTSLNVSLQIFRRNV